MGTMDPGGLFALDNGFVFAGVFFVFCLATLSLAAYAYLLFCIGRHWGGKPAVRRQPGMAFALVILGSALLGFAALFTPVGVIYRMVIGACVFLLHSHTLCIGLWTGYEQAKIDDAALFEKRTRDWLAEWEPLDGEETEL